jgi:hypothetical protein
MIHSSIIVCIYDIVQYSWQASHDNWSYYANKRASIWTMQIIKNLHSMTWCYGYSFTTNSLHHL